jgi:hypothetical protein
MEMVLQICYSIVVSGIKEALFVTKKSGAIS